MQYPGRDVRLNLNILVHWRLNSITAIITFTCQYWKLLLCTIPKLTIKIKFSFIKRNAYIKAQGTLKGFSHSFVLITSLATT